MSTSVAIGLGLSWLAAAATSLGWLMKSRGAHSSARTRHRRPVRSLRVMFGSRWFTVGVLVACLELAGLAVNIANIAGGILVFGDPTAQGLTGKLAEGAAFALICLGAYLTPLRGELATRASERVLIGG